MKTNSSIKISIFSIIGLACVLGIYYIFNHKGVDTRKAKTEISITTNELFKDFDEDKEASFNQYIEKAIEIKGILYQVTQKGDTYSLLLRGNNIDTLVLCEMQKDQASIVKTLTIGDAVKVKGILKGFLMDAILLNCIVLEEVNE
ncbi:hypothetical protein [uncultured Dokdonia sp.]|uniref:OB-fold protein n=1 Tax=uncultured Dokdonia sp. TaxID=575653 RepID=UPI0026350E96|nr:hypothetical protein [uncultured Dokdonia sp.]